MIETTRIALACLAALSLPWADVLDDPRDGAAAGAGAAPAASAPVSAPVSASPSASPSGPSPVEAAAAPVLVALRDVRRAPDARLGEELRMVVQLRGALASWNPWLTRFGELDYAGYAAWGDEQLTWEVREHFDVCERLFARRDSLAERLLRDARPYERFEVVAIVREIFLDEPWLEIVAARRLERQVTEGTVLHASRALALLELGRYSLAASELDRARTTALPDHATAELDRIAQRIEASRARTAPRR